MVLDKDLAPAAIAQYFYSPSGNSADQTNAIQLALNNSQGKPVVLSGKFQITKTISIPTGAKLIGSGSSSLIFAPASAAQGQAFLALGDSVNQVSDLVVDCQDSLAGSNHKSVALLLNSSSNAYVENITVNNCGGAAVRIQNGNNNLFKNINAINNAIGFDVFGSSTGNSFERFEVSAHDLGVKGINIYSGVDGAADNNLFSKGVVECNYSSDLGSDGYLCDRILYGIVVYGNGNRFEHINLALRGANRNSDGTVTGTPLKAQVYIAGSSSGSLLRNLFFTSFDPSVPDISNSYSGSSGTILEDCVFNTNATAGTSHALVGIAPATQTSTICKIPHSLGLKSIPGTCTIGL